MSHTPTDRSRPARFVALYWRLCLLCLPIVLGVGCPCIRNTVNTSPNLRWWLFSTFGANQICPEMLKRGTPLRLSADGNVIGRFFPTQCQHHVDSDARTVTVRFTGTGFAWTPVAGRIGFSMDAAVEYRMDFHMTDEATYVWGKTNRVVHGPNFQVGSIENKFVDIANRTPVGYLANTFGNQLVHGHLASGFTVVRTGDGDEFALGVLTPPQRPKKPFDTSGGSRYVFANETTEVKANQVDFLGPFEVADDDQALFFRARLNGPPVDVLIYPRGVGDLWREALQRGGTLAPPAQAPLMSFVLQPNVEFRQKFKLPKGQYTIVVENAAVVGSVAPGWNPLGMIGGGAALVSYTSELGDEDDKF
ncbi:MAG: hypothetical protein KIT72_13245 [Polyangiaceae bacterium]|nr:hypothetical protein [Polyangiaceae bacterium]MCW5791377.1 hypothetical protein [Polyangiaceae bacterium]